jgi:hypothetical protein
MIIRRAATVRTDGAMKIDPDFGAPVIRMVREI